MDMTMRMEMTFADSKDFTLFFSNWKVDSDGKFAVFIAATVVLSALVPLSDILQRKILRLKTPCLRLSGIGLFLWVKTAMTYMLMLAVMTYVTGLFFAVVAGWSGGRTVRDWVAQTEKGGEKNDDYPLKDMEFL